MSTPRRIPGFLLTCTLPVLLTACAGRQPQPQVRPPDHALGSSVVRTAESLLGVPYRPGGSDLRGFDCSGLVYYVFRQHGLRVPRDVKRQWAVGRQVSRNSVRPGDLLFFSTTGPGPTHVTVAVDRTRFIHAPSTRGVVRVEALSASYWARRFVGARRLVP